MTYLRVTVGSQNISTLASVHSAAGELAKLQAQLSSGQRIQAPSDDPSGTVEALTLQSAISRNDRYAASAKDALAWLSASNTAYSQMVGVVQQAQTAVVAGLNAGATDTTKLNTLADEVDGLRTSLLQLANSQYNGRPVFGGTTAGGVAYDANGNYVGDTSAVTRAIGPQSQVTVSRNGPDVFGSGGTDIFSTLSQVANTLRTNPAGLQASLTSLESAVSRLSAAQASEGATYTQVEQAQDDQVAQGTALTGQLSNVSEVDFAEMAVKIASANTAYQAVLQASATVKQLSLLDFLR